MAFSNQSVPAIGSNPGSHQLPPASSESQKPQAGGASSITALEAPMHGVSTGTLLHPCKRGEHAQHSSILPRWWPRWPPMGRSVPEEWSLTKLLAAPVVPHCLFLVHQGLSKVTPALRDSLQSPDRPLPPSAPATSYRLSIVSMLPASRPRLTTGFAAEMRVVEEKKRVVVVAPELS
ncbi:hypothetical protein BKA56DRAFT_609777 [Ilyonectria sp. MPI-CAGE-AT-0026]|nr:hypothetical protein BKA56DRAFT_609777 [Ilyonectria sp. MPI-CAGE-AT-0026]